MLTTKRGHRRGSQPSGRPQVGGPRRASPGPRIRVTPTTVLQPYCTRSSATDVAPARRGPARCHRRTRPTAASKPVVEADPAVCHPSSSSGPALVEPVGGAQLLDQEAGHGRRGAGATRHAAHTALGGRTPASPADATPGSAVARPVARPPPGRLGLEDLPDHPGLAVGDHHRLGPDRRRTRRRRPPARPRRCRRTSCRSVPCSGAQHAAVGRREPGSTIRAHQLGVPGAPDQVRTDHENSRAGRVGCQSTQPFRQRLRAGVVPAHPLGVGRPRAEPRRESGPCGPPTASRTRARGGRTRSSRHAASTLPGAPRRWRRA